MPTLTLTDIFASSDAPTSAASEQDGRIVRGFKIFRSGTFRDNAGVERKWTVADLRKMAENFHALKDSGTLPNVPVRENHSRDIRAVVGYFLDVRVEGRYLVADIEFTEPEAQGRYSRGTYRARSAEVGNYTNNEGQDFYPCILGVAFCDIPAVEGLYEAALEAYSADAGDVHQLHAAAPAKKAAAGKKSGDNEGTPEFKTLGDALKDILLDLHEAKDLAAGDPDTESALQQIVDALNSVVDDSDAPDGDGNSGDEGQGAGNHSASDPKKPYGDVEYADPGYQSDGKHRYPIDTEEHVRAAWSYINQGDNAKAYSAEQLSSIKGRIKAAAKKFGIDIAAHGQEDSVGLIKFTLGTSEVEVAEEAKPALEAFAAQFGQVTSERDALKTENETLKAEKVEAAYAARDAKVDSWVAGGKMTPGQVEAQKAFCRTLTDEQFTAHAAMVEQAPVLPIATQTATGTPAGPEGGDDKAAQVANHSATLKMLRLAGVDDTRLKESKPFKALVALGVTPEV